MTQSIEMTTKFNSNSQEDKPSLLDTSVMSPGKLRVIRRNGTVTEFEEDKISIAMKKAFLAVEGQNAADSARIHEIVARLTNNIVTKFHRRMPEGGTIHIEDIQDQVELALMREGAPEIARAYILYREDRRKAREKEQVELHKQFSQEKVKNVTLLDGSHVPLDLSSLVKLVNDACIGLKDVTPETIIKSTLRSLYDGIPVLEVSKALQLTTRTLIEKEPDYTYVAARLLLDDMRNEAFRFLEIQEQATQDKMAQIYSSYFEHFIEKGISLELLDPALKLFDIKKLVKALKSERDLQFTYLSLQTLYDRYFIHSNGHRFELPQAFFMRVAMGLAINETQKEEKAIEFYNLISSFDYMTSTPTLFNSGTPRPQLSSCFLTTVPDDLNGIFNAIKDNALLSKFAGGLGNDWTPVRAMNAYIKGTNGKSQGVMPFLKVANDTLVAVNQGGKRKGAGCAYLETWHLDYPEFIDARKNTGDERRRTHDMNTASWIPDLFLERVMENGNWTLFSPDETPDLHDIYGTAFKTAYIAYEEKAVKGEIKNYKTMPASSLWRKMLGMIFETGHPWLTFKDPCNIRSPQQHIGVVHSSNLCTEITLNTSIDEIAVCNLGSVNLPAHIKTDGQLDIEKLKVTIKTAVRMLDNVIDINYYSVPQARNANLKHRPVGLGIMGFQDALYKLRIPYSSTAAVEFADYSMEIISYFALEASSELAKERGCYESYAGSLWSQGILPIDSIHLLKKERGQYLEQDTTVRLDWDNLRNNIKQNGMRNSNVMAIAPTATISNICGVSQSIEPTYQNLYVKSNLSGEFTVINPYLVADLKSLNLWDEVMVNDLKYYDGSLQHINRIPDTLKLLYATAFEIDPVWLVEAASRRQKWIDQAQSLNLYMAIPSGKKLDNLYRLAWTRGLKTTYYLRSLGATAAEKSTISDGALNAVKLNTIESTPKVCSITDPDCESCQ